MTVITKSLMDFIMEIRMLQYLETSVYRGQELFNEFDGFKKLSYS